MDSTNDHSWMLAIGSGGVKFFKLVCLYDWMSFCAWRASEQNWSRILHTNIAPHWTITCPGDLFQNELMIGLDDLRSIFLVLMILYSILNSLKWTVKYTFFVLLLSLQLQFLFKKIEELSKLKEALVHERCQLKAQQRAGFQLPKWSWWGSFNW